jgi:hypothetical protein
MTFMEVLLAAWICDGDCGVEVLSADGDMPVGWVVIDESGERHACGVCAPSDRVVA